MLLHLKQSRWEPWFEDEEFHFTISSIFSLWADDSTWKYILCFHHPSIFWIFHFLFLILSVNLCVCVCLYIYIYLFILLSHALLIVICYSSWKINDYEISTCNLYTFTHPWFSISIEIEVCVDSSNCTYEAFSKISNNNYDMD